MSRDRWGINRRPTDALRLLRCALTSHRWNVNARATQRVCYRCWTVEELDR